MEISTLGCRKLGTRTPFLSLFLSLFLESKSNTWLFLSVYAVHRLADDQWEILAPDDDPRRPPWRRLVVVVPERRPIPAEPRRLSAYRHARSRIQQAIS